MAWMKSPGHRRNILSKNFEEVGVGLATGESKIGSVNSLLAQLLASALS